MIREKKQSEQDSLLTLLTPENGILLARVHSPRRLKGPFAAATEFLAYSDWTLFLRNDVSRVDGAEPKRLFYGLRQDPEAFALAAYFAQLTYDLNVHTQKTLLQLRLLLNCLAFLEEGKRAKPLIKGIFELQTMARSGYLPDLSGCCRCKKTAGTDFWFSPLKGQLFCAECGGGGEGQLPLTPDLLLALQKATGEDLKEAFSFTLGAESAAYFAKISEEFLLDRLEYKPKTLTYYQSLVSDMPPGGADV